MKRILITLCAVATMISCSEDDTSGALTPSTETQTFEIFQDVDQLASDFDQISVGASQDVQNASKSSNDQCVALELLVLSADNPIPGFNTYDYYSSLVIDTSVGNCDAYGWNGSLEYYIAGVLNNRWKDSTVYKAVQYRNGSSFDGYRISTKNPEVSTEFYDVFITGTITEADGTAYAYEASRSFDFENRYTPTEVITLTGNSSLVNVGNQATITSKTGEGESVIFKAECFDGFEFLYYPVEGVHEIESNFGVNFSVDYGDGSCDKEAILTDRDGQTITIDL